MARKNIATNNTNSNKEENMNYTTMKKNDLIALLEERDRQLTAANMQIEGLSNALKAIKTVAKAFCGGMNDIFTAELVKNATHEQEQQKPDKTVTKTEKKPIAKKPATKKPAEKPTEKPIEKPINAPQARPQTYKEAINTYKAEKYGDMATADAVKAMTKVIAEEWRQKARETGKLVVPRDQYKKKLWEEAEFRVREMNTDRA